MSAPAVPIFPHVQMLGYKLITGSAVLGFTIAWTRDVGATTEKGVLRAYDGSEHEIAEGANSEAWLLVDTDYSSGLGTITKFDLLARRGGDPDSAAVDVYPFTISTIVPPTSGSGVAHAVINSVEDIKTTSAVVSWNPSTIDTRATHWVIRLTVLGITTDTEVPWYEGQTALSFRLATLLTDLIPGQNYTVQVAGRYNGPSSVTYTSVFSGAVRFTTVGSGVIAGPDEVQLILNVPLPNITWECEAGPVVDGSWKFIVAPPGLKVTQRADIDGHTIADLDVVTEGTGATVAGIFDTLLTARIEPPDSVPSSVHKFVRFFVEGGLLLPWLHTDPTLYDLQWDLRGRGNVRSYYGIADSGGGKTTTTTSFTVPTTPSGTPEQSVSSVAESTTPPSTGNLLSQKRGDQPRLAIVIRDGRIVLDDGIGDVWLGIRLPDSEDDEYLFKLPGVASYGSSFGENRRYFLVEYEVTAEMLELVMSSDGVGSQDTIAEILTTYNDRTITSPSFTITFVEDVIREP